MVSGHCLETLSLTLNETLKWLSSLPTLMQESFWWWQCSDRCIICLYPHPPISIPRPPPFSPSLISLMVFVDVKHNVYRLSVKSSLTTSPTKSHCRQQIPMANPDRTHMQRHVKNPVSSFSTAAYHQHRYQKTLLQCSHKTSHRLCVSSVGWLWRSTLKQTELPSSKGRQINPF